MRRPWFLCMHLAQIDAAAFRRKRRHTHRFEMKKLPPQHHCWSGTQQTKVNYEKIKLDITPSLIYIVGVNSHHEIPVSSVFIEINLQHLVLRERHLVEGINNPGVSPRRS